MIDATFVEAPRQRNTREENATIIAGEIPEGWDDPKQAAQRRQKDLDARCTRKNNQPHYGYKKPINADAATQLIQGYAASPAQVHDSQVIDALLDTETRSPEAQRRLVYADSAYRSAEREADLAKQGLESQIHEKGIRAAPLTEDQKGSNQKSPACGRGSSTFSGRRPR